MSTEVSTSPTNKSSLASWWKTFKKKNPAIVEVHPGGSDRQVTVPAQHGQQAVQAPQVQAAQQQQQQQQTQGQPVGARPILRYKSRSSNYIRPLSSATNFSPSSAESLKAHRDTYLQSQQAKNNNDSQVFGVPLEKALSLASVNISISEDLANEGIQYGAIPVVVGKCCVFLKKNGTEVEGIFRVGGASRRVKELQFLFSTAPDYGRRLDWDGYTVHDAASLLRRFLNSLSEPLIPLDLYEQFREPLRSRPIILKFLSRKGNMKKPAELTEKQDLTPEAEEQETTQQEATAPVSVESESPADDQILEPTAVDDGDSVSPEAINMVNASIDAPSVVESKDMEEQQEQKDEEDDVKLTEEEKAKKAKKIRKYKKLIREIHSTLKEYSILLNELPAANQHLLFYILDLLTVFATRSSKNLMSNKNLAAIFQPSILSHPDHDMSPEEYALSAQVVEFLLEYYRRLLEATQKIKSERIQEQKKAQPPVLNIVISDTTKKADDSDASTNTPVTPSSSLLHPPVSKRAIRKHSKSLSSVNAPPDGLKFRDIKKDDDRVLLQHYNSNTDADDSEVDAERTPTRAMFPFDSDQQPQSDDTQLLSPPQKPFSPLHHKRSGESLTVSNASGSGNSMTSSSRFQNIKRPISVVFTGKEKNASIEDILTHQGEPVDREWRWDVDKSSNKKENWFNRLRSRSRSSEPRTSRALAHALSSSPEKK